MKLHVRIVEFCVVHRENDDDGKSDVSSTSQQSYDPLHPNFQDRDGEIGSSYTRDEQPSTVVLINQRARPDPGMNPSIHTRCIWLIKLHTHTQPFFTAQWILSGTTWVSRYQKKHSPTQHLSWSSIVPYLLYPSTMIHGILPVQSTHLTVFFHNPIPSFLCSTSWPDTLHFIFYTFLHPIIG